MKWQKPCGKISADDEIYYSIDSKNKQQHNKQTSRKKKPRESIEPDIRERENSSFSFQLHSITVINFKLISQTTSPHHTIFRLPMNTRIQFY